MKQLLLLFAILCFGIIANTNAQVRIYGKITGYDGKPTNLAMVMLWGDKNYTPLATTDHDGNYSFYFQQSGLQKFTYFGTFHSTKYLEFYIPENLKEININVQLPPLVITDPTKLEIMGDFNNFDRKEGLLPIKFENGKYYANVPNNSDTLIYQWLNTVPARNKNNFIFNGSQADFFIKGKGASFKSAIITKEKIVRVEFDPSKYSKLNVPSIVSSDNSEIEQLLQSIAKYQTMYGEFQRESRERHSKEKNNSIHSLKKEYVDRIIQQIDELDNKYARAYSIMNLFNIASYGQIIDINYDLKKYAQELIKTFDNSNIIWENYQSLVYVIETIENPFESKYLNEMINNNPSENIREINLERLLSLTRMEKYASYRAKYFQMCLDKFPNSKNIKNIIREYTSERTIAIGKNIPDFKLPKLDNLKDSLTAKDLLGKYTLVYIWAPWATDDDMPNLHRAYNIFKDKNFEILSIDYDAPTAAIIKFLDEKWKMPWTHVIATGRDKDPFADLFQITGVPEVFLIDPNGKIIEKGYKLQGNELIKNLWTFLK